MSDTNKPFYYLDGLINILIVDDDPLVLETLSEILNQHRLYSVDTASSAHEAERKLETPRRTHIVVMDLGLNDLKNNEFYILEKFSKRIAFIIFSGTNSPAKGFKAHSFGAKDFFEKSSTIDTLNFIETINRNTLYSVINPRYGLQNDTLNRSTDTLFERSPKFISQWAQQMGLTDRSLRQIWTKNLGANTKIIISTYYIFRAAFSYYIDLHNEKNHFEDSKLITTESYIYLEEFFHTHKSTITDLIAYGDIAAFMALD